MARAVSPADQAQLQKIGNGVYSGQQQVLEDMMSIQKQVNTLEDQWTAAEKQLDTQEAGQQAHLPVCPGEASIPSSQTLSIFKLQFADKRIALAGQYLPKFAPLVGKLHAAVLPQIDFGDDALAAWTQIEDPGLKQQVSASAHGAEQQSLGAVGTVQQLIQNLSLKAAQTVADKKNIERTYADAKGCQ
jgi:tRNA U34 5-methylaminomethyl-2-thiouridine-forming methyltransferase MnmC